MRALWLKARRGVRKGIAAVQTVTIEATGASVRHHTGEIAIGLPSQFHSRALLEDYFHSLAPVGPHTETHAAFRQNLGAHGISSRCFPRRDGRRLQSVSSRSRVVLRGINS